MTGSSDAGSIRVGPDERLQKVIEAAVTETLREFTPKKLRANELAITLWDVTSRSQVRGGSYRGDARSYPASVVKLFYLEAAHRWLEDGKLEDTAELRRALRDMIVDSSNDATHYVVDLLTGTTGGPELPAGEMMMWEEKREAINRYFHAQEYGNINVNQKTWHEGPYGRERVFGKDRPNNRNALTTDATARLMASIACGISVSAARSAEMRELLQRDPTVEAGRPSGDRQSFIAPALPPGAKLWSKAGWTSETRHDAAAIELAGGLKLILVIFTVNHTKETEIIPALARRILFAG